MGPLFVSPGKIISIILFFGDDVIIFPFPCISIKGNGGMNIFHFNTNNPKYTTEKMYK